MSCQISKIYKYLPSSVETISALCKKNKNWDEKEIIKKTGIYKKRIQHEGGIKNLILGLRRKNKIPELKDCGLLILVTQTPSFSIPSNIHFFQKVFNLKKKALAFDINQGCSGYLYGLTVCNSLMKTNNINVAALITCDTYSNHISSNNRTTRTIFGDGLTLTILKKKTKNKNFLNFSLGSDARGFDNFKLEKNEIVMNGSEMYNFATNYVPSEVTKILKKTRINKNQIKYFIFHQASKILLDTIQRKLNIPDKKFLRNLSNHGNTVSSTIPLILFDLIKKKKIKKNDHILLSGFGVGYSWGTCVYRH